MTEVIPQGKFRSACGNIIEINGRSTQHLKAHPDVSSILVEAISKARIGNLPFAEIEIDMGRTVGRKSRVETDPGSTATPMMFATRTGRARPSRVVVDVTEGDETSGVVIVAKRLKPGHYALITCWIGNLAQKEPWDKSINGPEHFYQCLKFWCQNALIYDPDTMGPAFESTWSEVLQPTSSDS